jgi:hypothetical protein
MVFYQSPRAPHRDEARDPIEESRALQSETDSGAVFWTFLGLAAVLALLAWLFTATSVQAPAPADANAGPTVQTQPATRLRRLSQRRSRRQLPRRAATSKEVSDGSCS